MTNVNNVALLFRDDLVTVKVSFNRNEDQEYTYVCEREIARSLNLDDVVVVKKAKEGAYGLAYVRQVDEDCDVDVNADFEYAWIVDRVSVERYEGNKAETEQVVKELKKKQRQSVREQAIRAIGIVDFKELGNDE